MPAADFSRFRLSKLGSLLESRNRSIRTEAVAALSHIIGSPSSDRETIVQLFALVVQYSQSSNWEGRVAAAELFNALLEKADKVFEFELDKTNDKLTDEGLAECLRAIDALSVREVLDTYRTLVSCEETSCTSSANSPCTLNSQQQRQLVDQYLEMDSSTGVSSRSFISDEELSNSSSTDGKPNAFRRPTEQEKMELKRELENNGQKMPLSDGGKSEGQDQSGELIANDEGTLWPLIHSQIVHSLAKCHLLVNLVHPKWNHRHGAALTVTKLCVQANKWLLPSPSALSAIAICLLQLLILDRFNDFVTGSSAVAPVREAAAQALSALLLALCEQKTEENWEAQLQKLRRAIASTVLKKIGELLQMEEEKHWQCRQTALLVLKYHFAVCEFTLDAERTLFDAVIHSLANDPFDEVTSSATQSLCSLFSNPNVNERTTKQPLIDRVMESAWILMDCPSRMTQFREGVDSVLVDLLRLVAFWLRVSPSAPLLLTDVRLRFVVSLLDCFQHSPTRAICALDCIFGALEQRKSFGGEKGDDTDKEKVGAVPTDWSGQTLFFLLKQLFRCLLFTPPSAPPLILAKCQQTLDALMVIVDTDNEHQRNSQTNPERVGEEGSGIFFRILGQSIGVWLCCLVYDHRFTEIDVFLHHVDGPNSSRDSPREIFCGDEMRFLNATQCDEVLVERKALAAQFLAPLFHALFNLEQPNSFSQNQQQTLPTNVQLLFVPYLRSNSLYQKFGAALVANAWAVFQNMKNDAEKLDAFSLNSSLASSGNGPNGKAQTQLPHILLQEIANSLNVAATSTKLYDEVSFMVTALSTECNEFQQYCVRKGVPKDALVPITKANSMEEVILATFRECEQRLSRADDRQALSARHKIIAEQIERTKLAIRTYTNRITALFASALFHFACNGTVPLPAQLTPWVKPLVDALESISRLFSSGACLCCPPSLHRSA